MAGRLWPDCESSRMKTLWTALLLTLSLNAAPLKTFEGNTENSKKELQIKGPWKLSWDFEGTALRVDILSPEGQPGANPIRQAGSGRGSMTVEKGGSFLLEISSAGHYRLSIEELDGSAGSTLPVFEGNLERKGSSVFTAPTGWSYRCSCSGGVLKATLYDAQRNPVGEPVTLLGGGSVTRKVEKAGSYFFMIQSTGPYKIEVLPR